MSKVKDFVLNNSVDEGFLQDWYQHSVNDTDPPVWTDEHIAELAGDFYLIPKEAVDGSKTVKLHARVTKEIEISEEDARVLLNYLCGKDNDQVLQNITHKFSEGVDPGNYESGYIPISWLEEDLKHQMPEADIKYLNENKKSSCYYDIDL